jgi:hypothetical protein
MNTAAVVIGVLVCLWIGKRVLSWAANRWIDRHVARTGACETCFVMRRAYLVKSSDDRAPIGVCDVCAHKKIGAFALEHMLKSGRAVRA